MNFWIWRDITAKHLLIFERIVDVLNFAISECQLTHPINAASHSRRQAHIRRYARRGIRMKSIGSKIVIVQLLAIVVRGKVIDMHLITTFDVIEKEILIGHIENQLLHRRAQMLHTNRFLWIFVRIRAGEQRMEYDERFVQIPNENAIGSLGCVDILATVLWADATCWARMCMSSAARSFRRARRTFVRRNGCGAVRRYRNGRVRWMWVRHNIRCAGVSVGRTFGQASCHMIRRLATTWTGRANVRRIARRIVITADTILIVVIGRVILLGAAKLAEIIVAIAAVQLCCVAVAYGRRSSRGARIVRRQICAGGRQFGRSWRICGCLILRVKRRRVLLHAIVIATVVIWFLIECRCRL